MRCRILMDVQEIASILEYNYKELLFIYVQIGANNKTIPKCFLRWYGSSF